jgi:hypothetical protein
MISRIACKLVPFSPSPPLDSRSSFTARASLPLGDLSAALSPSVAANDRRGASRASPLLLPLAFGLWHDEQRLEHLRAEAPIREGQDGHDAVQCARRLRTGLRLYKLLHRRALRRAPATQLSCAAFAHLLRDLPVRDRAAQIQTQNLGGSGWGWHTVRTLGDVGHDVAQPAAVLVDRVPDVLAVHVVQQAVDRLDACGVAGEARNKIV